jgi:hypothetical protein
VADFGPVEARLRRIIDQYRDRLEPNPLYGVDTLRRPGGKAHDYFAGLRTGKRYVSFYLMPVYARPELLDDVSPALRKRMQGKACFNFATVDEQLMDELDALVARSYDVFVSDAYPRTPVSSRADAGTGR